MSYSEEERDPIIDDYERERLRLNAEITALRQHNEAAEKRVAELEAALRRLHDAAVPWLTTAEAGYPMRAALVKSMPRLAGHDLACWCAPDRPCHADVLLELANA